MTAFAVGVVSGQAAVTLLACFLAGTFLGYFLAELNGDAGEGEG